MSTMPEINTLYSNYEDFRSEFLPSTKKKILVLGMTGAAKSSLLNCLSGNPLDQTLVYDDDDLFGSESYKFGCKGEIFPIGHDAASQTQETGWSLVKWFGIGQELIFVDSPGLCDSKENARRHMPDWQAKMKKIGTLDLILIVLPDIYNPRFTDSEREFLKELNIAFDVGNGNVWRNVAICFAKCNNNTKSSWISHAKKIKKQLPLKIKQEFEMNYDVPIFFFSTIRGQMPCGGKVDMSKALLDYINTRTPLETDEVKEIRNQRKRRLEAEKREREKAAQISLLQQRNKKVEEKLKKEIARRNAGWITAMCTFGHKDQHIAKSSKPYGYTLFDVDLNQGAKKTGDYVYLAYKSDDGSVPIGDVNVVFSKTHTGNSIWPGWEMCYHDCNCGSKGQYVYIIYRHASKGEYPIDGFTFSRRGNAGYLHIGGYTPVGCDLNIGAGGSYNYLYIKRSNVRYE